jgi:hypothetical protein
MHFLRTLANLHSDRVLSDDEEEEEEEPQRSVKYDLLTPCSKVKTARELIIRAKELEKFGDSMQALIDYREGNFFSHYKIFIMGNSR